MAHQDVDGIGMANACARYESTLYITSNHISTAFAIYTLIKLKIS